MPAPVKIMAKTQVFKMRGCPQAKENIRWRTLENTYIHTAFLDT
jgi:hypothetical protein